MSVCVNTAELTRGCTLDATTTPYCTFPVQQSNGRAASRAADAAARCRRWHVAPCILLSRSYARRARPRNGHSSPGPAPSSQSPSARIPLPPQAKRSGFFFAGATLKSPHQI